MSISVNVDSTQFYAYMGRLRKEFAYSVEETVKEGARLFARSAARHTPPAPGKAIPRYSASKRGKTDLWNRPIDVRVYERTSGRLLPAHRVRELVTARKELQKKARERLGIEYVVAIRFPRTRRSVKRAFDTLSAAKEAAKIRTRGLLRAGWWGTVISIGGTAHLKEKYGDRVAALVGAVSRLTAERPPDGYCLTLTNAVEEAGGDRGKAMGVADGLEKAGKAMKAMIERKINMKIK